MNAYRWSTNLKLGLIVFAVLIAVASLWYTSRFVERLREREQAIIQLWADAQAEVAQQSSQPANPYQEELRALQTYLAQQQVGALPGAEVQRLEAMRQAVVWAQSMPPAAELTFILDNILKPDPLEIPAVITDSASRQPVFWRNVSVPDTLTALDGADSAEAVRRLRALSAEMDEVYPPIPMTFAETSTGAAGGRFVQYVHYDESGLVKELRVFPYVQLLFVALFILVGYVGFSYVRRSEQSSLWVGMAREAAHQLGTPISSLMGWLELLRMGEVTPAQRMEAYDEIESDIHRLRRVASRFSDIGSMPKLEVQPVAPVVESTARYIRRRIPQQGQNVALRIDVPLGLRAPLNAELFEWVIENLLKNALDAMDKKEGCITVRAERVKKKICIEVEDTGRGIERRQRKNVFRPGYSTKKRGWGLGLSLARRIVEDYHGGALALAESKPGAGTTFRIELPAASDSGRE